MKKIDVALYIVKSVYQYYKYLMTLSEFHKTVDLFPSISSNKKILRNLVLFNFGNSSFVERITDDGTFWI